MKTFLLVAMLALSSQLFAQAPQVKYSAGFDEPDNLATKVVLCRNGNTLMFNFSKQTGLTVMVFDSVRGIIATESIPGDIFLSKNFRNAELQGLFPIGDDACLYLAKTGGSFAADRLVRARFSSTNGKLIDVGETAAISAEELTAARAGGSPKYTVRKDPHTDAYAIAALYAYNAPAGKKREGSESAIFLRHYNGAHEEIGRGVLTAKARGLRENVLSSMLVIGASEVWTVTMPYTEKLGELREASALVLTRLRGRDTASIVLKDWHEKREGNVFLAANSVEQRLDIVTRIIVDEKRKGSFGGGVTNYITYATNILGVSLSDGGLKYARELDQSLPSTFRTKNFGVSAPYKGLPIDALVNENGKTTVVSLESGGASSDISAVAYDRDGKPARGFAVRRGNVTRGGVEPMMRIRHGNQPMQGSTRDGAGPGFFAHDYISGKIADYVFFNDHPGNFGRDGDKSPKELIGISDAQAVCFRITGASVSRLYLFGKPERDFDNRFADFYSGAYDPGSGTYAVMIVEKNGRRKQSRLAWVKFP